MSADRLVIPFLVAVLASSLAIDACAPAQECPAPTVVVGREPPQEFPSNDEHDGGPEGAPRSACLRACANLSMLGCPESRKVSGGDSCTTTCEHLVSSGFSSLDPECIAGAKTVDAVRECNVRCR